MSRKFDIPQGEYWEYLRKSRADLEAEARGEGETLAKHRKVLLGLAKECDVSITRVYSEVESGESIFHRPEMVKLLRDLETNPPKGVFVMDIDRFGRGDKIDQGIIERAFKESGTLIVTPGGVYDMNDESGEFNVEVRSFLARLELKMIKKRMQSARVASVEDGNYIGTRAPYGYMIHIDERGRTLQPHPEQADIVRMIFALYTHDDPERRLGSNKIANKLNDMMVLTYTGKPWEASTILSIVKNEVYCGRIQWRKKEQKKSKIVGKKRDTRTRPRGEWIDVIGRHEPLISDETYKKARLILEKKYHVPYKLVNGITNPLAGLIRCGLCGSSMVYRSYTTSPAHIICIYKGCDNKSSRFEFVESELLSGMIAWMDNYRNQWLEHKPEDVESSEPDDRAVKEKAIRELQKEKNDLEIQRRNLHDLLERGVYSEEIFLSRSKDIADRIQAADQSIEMLEEELLIDAKRRAAREEILPRMANAVEMYKASDDPAEKNLILKSVLDYGIYKKERSQWNDDFSLIVFPQFPS